MGFFLPASCSLRCHCRELQNLKFSTSSCLTSTTGKGELCGKKLYILLFLFFFFKAFSYLEQYSVYLCVYVQVCEGEHLLACDLYK